MSIAACLPRLRVHVPLAGLQCYLGHIQHITSFAERRDASMKGMARACDVVRQLKAQQIPCQVGTWQTCRGDGNVLKPTAARGYLQS